jgi:AraC family transcriptional regulator
MIQKLPGGCYLGEVVVKRRFDGLILTETQHHKSNWLPVHSHQNAYFCFVRRGEYSERFGNAERLCKPMTLTFHPPEEKHTEQVLTPRTASFNLEFEPERLHKFQQIIPSLREPAELRGGPAADVMLRLHHEFHRDDAVTPLAVEGLTLELLSHFYRAGKSSHSAVPLWLHQVRDLMHDQFAEKLELSHLAHIAGVHPVYFIQVFRKHFDCTPGTYQRRLRVEAAKQFLMKNEIGLSEIAVRVGFVDQSHFTRTFKQHTGITPAAFRRLARGTGGRV